MSQLASQLKLWPAQRLPVLLQSEAAECGIACLGMVAGFYDHHLNIQQLRALFGSSIAGCTMKDLVEFASTLSLSGRALKLEPQALGRGRGQPARQRVLCGRQHRHVGVQAQVIQAAISSMGGVQSSSGLRPRNSSGVVPNA